MRRVLLIASILAILAALMSKIAFAASPSGFAQFNNDPLPGAGPPKSGTWGPISWPGKGDITVDYTNVGALSHMGDLVDGTSKPEWDAILPATSPSFNVPAVRFENHEQNASAKTMKFTFSQPTSRFMLVIMDVDRGDVVQMTAQDADGNTITDFSSWTNRGDGDKTVSAGGGNDPAPAPVWTPSTGTLTTTDTLNSNRSFIALEPDVRISSITFDYDSMDENSRHVYYSFYSIAGPDLTVGDTVWEDLNNNGQIDSGEKGIPNVSVELYDSGDNLQSQTTTDSNGKYEFSGLSSGDYYIKIPASNFAVTGSLASYRSSSGGSTEPAQDPDTDINSYDRGSEAGDLLTGGVVSGVFTLFYETEPINDGDSSYDTNLTVDFGFVPPAETLANTGQSTEFISKMAIAATSIGVFGVVLPQYFSGRRLQFDR